MYNVILSIQIMSEDEQSGLSSEDDTISYLYVTTPISDSSSDNNQSSTSSSDDSDDMDEITSINTFNTNEEEAIEDIFFFEQDFLNSEKEQHHYYIGNYRISRDKKYILYSNSIQNSTFFKYPINDVLNYLYEFSIFMTLPNIDIMQLFILDDSTYTVVLKTYWLRLIQRHWKKAFLRRKTAIQKRCNPFSIRYFETHGKYPDNSYSIPTLNGLLSEYNSIYLSKVIRYKN